MPPQLFSYSVKKTYGSWLSKISWLCPLPSPYLYLLCSYFSWLHPAQFLFHSLQFFIHQEGDFQEFIRLYCPSPFRSYQRSLALIVSLAFFKTALCFPKNTCRLFWTCSQVHRRPHASLYFSLQMLIIIRSMTFDSLFPLTCTLWFKMISCHLVVSVSPHFPHFVI